MATLQDYAASAFYEFKQNFTGQDFVLGKDVESWVQELSYGASKPTVYTITAETAIDVDDETASLSADVAVKLYRRDVLKFPGKDVIVIAEDIEIGTTATTVNILPAVEAIAADAEAVTYGMIPILSMAEGGLPEMSGTDAEAMNKEQGLYTARRTVKRDGSITISGAMLRNDPSLRLLQDVGLGSRNIYYQARYAPFTLADNDTYTEGAGPGAYEVVTTLTNNSYPSGGQEFVQVNYTMNFAGRPDQYAPLLA
jgi:hypothetical protein